MVYGWYAFFFKDKNAAKKYKIDSILDVIGEGIDIVTLEKRNFIFLNLKNYYFYIWRN